jgi:hypothetical protein
VSAWEEPPAPGELTDDELDEYLAYVYEDLREAYRDRHLHNRDGFFADVAGSEACVALGHPDSADALEVDGHERGWTGEVICTGTRFGVACTECEGECAENEALAMSERAEFWALFSTERLGVGA